jgi:hypothetical protein
MSLRVLNMVRGLDIRFLKRASMNFDKQLLLSIILLIEANEVKKRKESRRKAQGSRYKDKGI